MGGREHAIPLPRSVAELQALLDRAYNLGVERGRELGAREAETAGGRS